MTRRMVVNIYPGRCGCGTFVAPQKGYVHERRITCIQCIPLEPYTTSASSIMYQGCADERESLSEWFYDNFANESHYLGWEVGGQ